MLEHGFDVGDARGDGGIAAEPARLAAAPEVEAGEGEAGLRKILASRRYLSLSLEAPMPWQAITQGAGWRRGRCSTPTTEAPAMDSAKGSLITTREDRRGRRC